MSKFRLTQIVFGPAGKVFASVADVTTGATWPPTVRAASREDVGPIGVGSRFRLSTRGMGDQFVEVAAEPPGRLRTALRHRSHGAFAGPESYRKKIPAPFREFFKNSRNAHMILASLQLIFMIIYGNS